MIGHMQARAHTRDALYKEIGNREWWYFPTWVTLSSRVQGCRAQDSQSQPAVLGGDKKKKWGPTKFGIKLFSERWVDHSDRDKRARPVLTEWPLAAFARYERGPIINIWAELRNHIPVLITQKVFMWWPQHFVCINICVPSQRQLLVELLHYLKEYLWG